MPKATVYKRKFCARRYKERPNALENKIATNTYSNVSYVQSTPHDQNQKEIELFIFLIFNQFYAQLYIFPYSLIGSNSQKLCI